MKLVFLGTPDFAVPSLERIIASKHEILAVVTQPDKPVGRNNVLTPPPVKVCALKHGLKVLQYNKIRVEGVEDLKNLAPDIMVTCAFGQILSQEIIDIAPRGIINVHASLLPKYRGAAPIQYSVINGDTETGVTIMQTEAGIDTGDILSVEKTPIDPDETAGELFERLSELGAKLIVETLDKGVVMLVEKIPLVAAVRGFLGVCDTSADRERVERAVEVETEEISVVVGVVADKLMGWWPVLCVLD